ncbi:hypothetical protein MMC24_007153, partial [Lignoscripta atroalba]|nr:hypothetical protein [Lignoscripta atroalba]
MPEALTPLQSSGVGEEPGPATMYTSTSESRSATASRSRQRSLSFDDVIAPVGDEQKNQLDLQQQATTSSSNTAEDMAADTNQWTAEKEARLQFVQRKLHEANKRWSAEQEKWLGEVDHLRELKRKVKAREKRSMRREEREKKKLKRTEATKGVMGVGKENEEKGESGSSVEKKETDKGE